MVAARHASGWWRHPVHTPATSIRWRQAACQWQRRLRSPVPAGIVHVLRQRRHPKRRHVALLLAIRLPRGGGQRLARTVRLGRGVVAAAARGDQGANRRHFARGVGCAHARCSARAGAPSCAQCRMCIPQHAAAHAQTSKKSRGWTNARQSSGNPDKVRHSAPRPCGTGPSRIPPRSGARTSRCLPAVRVASQVPLVLPMSVRPPASPLPPPTRARRAPLRPLLHHEFASGCSPATFVPLPPQPILPRCRIAICSAEKTAARWAAAPDQRPEIELQWRRGRSWQD